MNYEDLLNEADKNGLIAKEKPLISHDGLIVGNKIAIKKDLTITEKACTLAEELSHYYINTGDILDQSKTSNRKQEHIARSITYNKLVGIRGIINAYNSHCQSIYDMADFLDVTVEFLTEAILLYRSKYGKYVEVDDYLVTFEPTLCVVELIEKAPTFRQEQFENI